MPRFKAVAFLAALLAGCAGGPPADEARAPAEPKALPSLSPLPASFVTRASCPGCRAVTLTLRPDGAFLSRERLGSSEFYDFGRWRLDGETLHLAGGRDQRRYPLDALRRAEGVEALRGPFRLVGFYDGTTFRECLTGLEWRLDDTRAAQVLNGKVKNEKTLVALDAQFEGRPEVLRVFRPASILEGDSCNG